MSIEIIYNIYKFLTKYSLYGRIKITTFILGGRKMKKIIKTIAFTLAFFVLFGAFSGCGKKKEEEKIENPPVKVEQEEEKEPEIKEKYLDNDDKPIAVVIDNDGKDSWPHSGLSDAYMIYEMYVEGGVTRLLAFFKGQDTKKIGPIRSVRHYFYDFVFEHDAFFTGFGVSPKASEDLKNLGVRMMNGILGDESYFWREEKYRYDYHSVYTSIENIKKAMSKKGISDKTQEKFLSYNDEMTPLTSENNAEKIVIPYNSIYKVTYEYNSEEKNYKRTMNSATVHKSPDGELYAPVNIIIQEIPNYTIAGDSAGRQDMRTVGSGKGKYITGGKAVDITWQKNSRKGKTIFKTADGNELKLNPGLTFVNIVPPSMRVSIE